MGRGISLKKSLGVFKPVKVQFEIKKIVPKDEKEHRVAYDQYYLFDKKLRPIEQIPFNGYYIFKCQKSPQCTGHKLMIHDWEFMEAYRNWCHKYPEQTLLQDKIRETWFDKLCGPAKDTYFYVGNIWQRPKQFMVLGVFYPPKSAPVSFMPSKKKLSNLFTSTIAVGLSVLFDLFDQIQNRTF